MKTPLPEIKTKLKHVTLFGMRLTAVSALHYFRLIFRSVLFLSVLCLYINRRLSGSTISLRNSVHNPLLGIVWALFMLEMILRFFPSRIESPGCQKQFSRNYRPTGSTNAVLHDNNAVMICAILWIVLNGAIGAFKMTGIFDDGIMLLFCLAFSVCDTVCILFFCPFQTWLMKNRCCVSCRIYNWDYAMMFTPLFFIPGVYTWTLLFAAVVLLLRWEITVWRFPERFSENTNSYLACANCTEQLCTHKKQLIRFKKELIVFAEEKADRILMKKSLPRIKKRNLK